MSERPSVRQIPFGRPWITADDKAAVARVLDGTVLTHGPECHAFESEFALFAGSGCHAVTMSSCMAALHMSCVALGIGAGDEVIVPAMTHTATVHAPEFCGAVPRFVDCDTRTGNVTAEGVERAVTPRTKAIVVVHFAGIPCDMPAIVDVARRRGLTIIEDCALAVGASVGGTHVGLFGDAGCFSFYPVKHFTTAEGGMLISRREDLARTVAMRRAFGVVRGGDGLPAVPGMYDVVEVGLNYRMSELQAALGRSQLNRIDRILSVRARHFAALKDRLSACEGLDVLDAVQPGASSSHYCLVVVLPDRLRSGRNDLVLRLQARGIGTSIYYPQPVPRMSYYRKKYGYRAGDYPGAETISDGSFALPVGPHLSDDDLNYMADAVSAEIKGMY